METIFNISNSFYIIITIFIIGAIGSLILRNQDKSANIWGNTLALIGSIFGLMFAAAILISGTTPVFNIPSTFPLLSMSFNIDYLSAFFMLIICLIAILCSIYAFDYSKHFYKKYSLGTLGFFYNIFIASMILVVTAHNALFFLIVWEIMSLASYFLVIFERQKSENIEAGSIYFTMTHIGTAFIILSFLLMYSVAGSFDFEVIKNGLINAPELIKNLIFITALIGFGTKAGIIPFHIWLPKAHPAAPSHVSGLMSGVMIKTGIYMLVRIGLILLPNPPLWWGVLILVLGSVSSVLGVLYALAEHDIKKLLAYHSIENIGIILLGLGGAFIFTSAHLYVFAALGLVAALYHTLNHATFKALLFLGAGSVISETHTRNMEEYGGLIKYMPQTAFLFLIGSMAISALPPFNGFFSEWLTFQTLFSAINQFNVFTKYILIFSIASLAFTGGLAAACFVKAFGATFLARPRSEEVKHAKESSLSLLIGMTGLAALTVILGFLAGPISGILKNIANNILNIQNLEPVLSTQTSSVNIQNNFAYVSMPVVLLLIILATAISTGFIFLFTRNNKVKVGRTWDCGSNLTPRMEITATGFSRSFITIFKGILRPQQEVEVEYHDEKSKYFPKTNAITLELRDIYMPYLYNPFQSIVIKFAHIVKKIQVGHVNAYILYIFVTLISILFILAI
ncbi:MAG: hydrogenase 4 subunit B [Candidatus Daviesbacteria bacterium]|nr:hydrogenase 4 subunit B [Candidatus Daviesbacteria bacterium]